MCYEILHYFIKDLSTRNYWTAIDYFIAEFKDSNKFSIKLAILSKMTPLVKKKQMETLMKIFEDVLEYRANESIFTKSCNPL